MTKKVKKFHDDYDSIFLEPDYEAIKNQNKTIKIMLRATKKKKQTNTKGLFYLFILVVSVTVIYLLISPSNSNETETISSEEHSKKRTEKYVFVFPLRKSKVRQATNIDSEKLLQATLDKRKLIINDEYQFEILGKTEIHSQGLTEWSVEPVLIYPPSEENIVYVQSYEEEEDFYSIHFSIYGNVINGLELFLDLDSGSTTKVFPKSDIGTIQNGYVLEHMRDIDGFIRNVIHEYFIFPDGAGIITQTEASREVSVSPDEIDSMTDEVFEETFNNELSFIDKTVRFSKNN